MKVLDQQCRRLVSTAVALGMFAALVPAAAAARTRVAISLVDAAGKIVQSSAAGTLRLRRKYAKGDRVVVAGAKHLAVKVDEHFAETILYCPKGVAEYPIPLWQKGKYAKKYPHPPKAFHGETHVITARAATAAEVVAYRNVACNPMDPHGSSTMFPHATSNSEWGEAGVFAARNAIDGFVETTGDHHSWPRQSWGPHLPGGKHPELEFAIEFGRTVEIDKLVIVVRHNVRQNNHWKRATVEFSDGSSETIDIAYNGERQELKFAKRRVDSLKFVKLVPDKPGKYAAFVEVEAWGRDVR